MQNVLGIWSGLDNRKRAAVILATLSMFAAVLILSKVAGTRSMELLYAGLDGKAAGEVVAALEQNGSPYEIRGSAVFVEASERDRLRMVLAGQGLPANGMAGYEILDGLSGFGTTSQMFDAAYWRAKEGELARTITASPQIRSARVHISRPPATGFRRDSGTTASVSVTPAAGGIGDSQAKALRYLVASAVPGLGPEDVSVIDGERGIVLGAGDATSEAASSKRADTLKGNVERILNAHLGAGNAIVEVSVETVTERESIIERRLDPESRVAVSTESEERSNASRGSAGGAVTVASNLPDGDADSSGSDTSSQNSESRERVNFEVSETQRELLRVPGAIKRLTVAVLVNATSEIDESGTQVAVPRGEDELESLRALVAAAVGYDEARGDMITIRSMEFQPVEARGTLATASLLDRFDVTTLAQIGLLSLVALALGLFVVRPILTRRDAAPMLELATHKAAGDEHALPVPRSGVAPRDAARGEQRVAPTVEVVRNTPFDVDGDHRPPALSDGSEDPVARLKQMIRERQAETVEVLRTWMEDEKEKV